ncbi:heterokaryon incompatibility protein HET-C [Phlebopus sp. FC_14]|nr:heterokaryon incompatibility protein HET-C [Phlebopus sp. FC_14]
MPSNLTVLLLLFVVFAFCLSDNGVFAFGAGNIPSFAYMEGKAFRHGDIEDALSDLLKKGAGASGFALASLISKGTKFNGLDVKRVYFGNWLRDYSQAVDIGALKKVNIQTIINLCMVLGFMAHGYATEEFEVTEQRLGCYLPTEHIDNPKGYGEGEDARRYHPGLRGPVDPRELEVDPRTGMKNYIANENGPWDTSKALVRRTLERCIHLGRQYRANNNKPDQYEAFRLLGQALHTLEDFPAHSNFCELALVSQGHQQVFLHMGDSVRIQAPSGKRVAPLVTGTFGSSDFLHSLLGEIPKLLLQASVSDLNKELDNARTKSRSSNRGPVDNLRDLLFKLPGGNDMSREMDGIERIRAGPAQGGKRPEDMSPQEVHTVLWQVLSFRDSVSKKMSATIEKIPGLGSLIDSISESISVFVFTTLEPFIKPIMQTATSGLQLASGEVINTHDQYESDPTHSFLSKDHFNLILNEPAGHLAKIILTHAVNLVVKAWDDTSINVHQVTEEVLQCLFHPDFHDPNSKIQSEMLKYMRTWVQDLGSRRDETLHRLSKEAVRAHQNIRLSGTYAYNQGVQTQQSIQGYAAQIPGVAQAQSLLNMVGGAPQGNRRDGPQGPQSGTIHLRGSASGAWSHAQPQYHGSAPSHYPSMHAAGVEGVAVSSFLSAGSHAHPGSPPSPSRYGQGHSSAYAQPSPGVPSFPGADTGGRYASSYAPSYPTPSGPSFGDSHHGGGPAHGHHAHSAYAPPTVLPPGGPYAPVFPSPGGPPAGGYGHSFPEASGYRWTVSRVPFSWPRTPASRGRHHGGGGW